MKRTSLCGIRQTHEREESESGMIKLIGICLSLLVASTAAQALECEAPGKKTAESCVFVLSKNRLLEFRQTPPPPPGFDFYVTMRETSPYEGENAAEPLTVDAYDATTKTIVQKEGWLAADAYTVDIQKKELTTTKHLSIHEVQTARYRLNDYHLKLIDLKQLISCGEQKNCTRQNLQLVKDGHAQTH